MSVSDPLLKRLKATILTLRTAADQQPVKDHDATLRPLSETVEDILRKGLKQPQSLFQPQKKDYWHWMESVPALGTAAGVPVHPIFEFCVNEVKNSKRVFTSTGRGRLLIRMLMQKRLLAWPMQFLIVTVNEVNQFYDDLYSILGNEILAQIFLSLIHELGHVTFELTLRNASFLDDTWQLPVYRQYEFVPCRNLGLDLVAVNGHQFIERVIPGSVAEEDKKVEPGDVLDEFLGYSLKRSRIRLKDLMKDNQGWPIHCCVIKARCADGSVYSPILHLLRMVRLQGLLNHSRSETNNAAATASPYDLPEDGDSEDRTLPMHARLEEDFPDDVPAQNPDMFPVYSARYVGSTRVGHDGGVHMIETAVERVLRNCDDPALYKPVRIELAEKEVIVEFENSPLYNHAYPQISSCGRRIDCPKFFAYIAGESTCTLSRNFECFVFEARSEMQSKTILCSIAQGFERTHWAL